LSSSAGAWAAFGRPRRSPRHQSLIYEVANALPNAEDVAHSIRGLLRGRRNTHFRLGTASGVDWHRKELLLTDGERIAFDYLVLAAGLEIDFRVPRAAEYGLPLKSLDDANPDSDTDAGRTREYERVAGRVLSRRRPKRVRDRDERGSSSRLTRLIADRGQTAAGFVDIRMAGDIHRARLSA
jgi:hypothetical protein